MVQQLNGSDWPDLAVSLDLPAPKDHYSPQELAQTYATLAVHHGILWPRVVSALEYLRGHLIGVRGEFATVGKEVKLLREALQGQIASAKLGLPPMRPEAPSAVTMVDSITKKVSGEFERIAKESQGPYVEADPKRLLKVVEAAVADEIAKKEAARRAAEDAAALETFKEAARARKKFLRKVAGAFAIAVATAAGSWAWGKAQGHVEERQAAAVARLSIAVAAPAGTAAAAAAPLPAPAAATPLPTRR